MPSKSDFEWAMRIAISDAQTECARSGDVPVAAVLLNESAEVVAVGWNDRELTGDPTGHAEIVAIRNAVEALGAGGASESKSRSWSLEELTLIVTLEPCVMCAGAIVAARIPRVVFGAWDTRVGAAGSLYDLLRDGRLGRPVEVIGGVLEAECSALMTQFFEAKRISGSR